MGAVKRWPKQINLAMSFTWPDDLSDRLISVYAVEEGNKSNKVTMASAIPGQAADNAYSISADTSTLTVGTLYRRACYTDDDASGNRATIIPNPSTDNPDLFEVYDPDGDV